MKIKVETNKGEKLSFADVVYRELVGRLLTIFLAYLPYLAVAFTNKKKGLHDFIPDTVVVKEDFNKSIALNFKLNPRKSAEVDKKVLKFGKVHMRTYRHSGLLISKFAL